MQKLSFQQLESMALGLDATHHACGIRISELRKLMDISCDQGEITLREWRLLLEKIAVVQKQLACAD